MTYPDRKDERLTDSDHTVRTVPALQPRDESGFQFACYADCCSGILGGANESTFAAVNAVVSRLEPQPEFICFPGDEVQGLTSDAADLRRQWRYWQNVEMGWARSRAIPVHNTPGNHTVYDDMSAGVFRDMIPHLGEDGPGAGLSYVVRQGARLLVFIDTTCCDRGGEGRVDVAWLAGVLAGHADATHKLVFGHHPVFAVNGLSGRYQREIDPDDGRALWALLVEHGVVAYVCSHILAFDAQVRDGVLQIVTGGAGTAPLMPESHEYHHCVQAAVDARGLRCQVLDTEGRVRESLDWPLSLPPSDSWPVFAGGSGEGVDGDPVRAWRITGRCPGTDIGRPQTLLDGRSRETGLADVWIGLRGREGRLTVLLTPRPGRSPHCWSGPALARDGTLDVQVAIHAGLGPGGILWRGSDRAAWSSLSAASPWGAERLERPLSWTVGHGFQGPDAQPFLGSDLQLRSCVVASGAWG